jgi:uncharacterized protein (TIGR00369 family)
MAELTSAGARQPGSGNAAVPPLWRSPLGQLLALPETVQIDERSCQAELDVGPELVGYGAIFGGWLACLADHLAAMATLGLIGAGRTFTTAELRIRFLHPVLPGTMRATAAVDQPGTRILDVEVLMVQHGRTCATATVTEVLARAVP